MVRVLRQAASHIRSSLVRKIGLILLAPFCGAMLAALLFWYFLGQTASAPVHVNLAGRQRMLAVQIGDWARMVAGGQDEDRPRLRQLIAGYDRTLAVLERGGEIDGRRIVPLPDALRGGLSRLQAQWGEIQPRLLVIADRPAGSPEVDRAARDLKPAIDTLQASADELTAAVEARTETWRRRVFAFLIGGIGLNLLLVVWGFWFSRRHIVDPVLQLDAAASRISGGDYSVRVTCTTRDELCRLAESFNEMAGRIHGTVEELARRHRQAERFIESLPFGTVLVDARLQVVRTNRACRAMLGLGEEPVQGCRLEEICPHPALRDRLRGALEGRDAIHGLRLDLDTPAGVLPLRVTAVSSRLLDEDNQLVVVAENLTEEERLRLRAAASELSFRTLIEQAPDSIAVHRDGRFIYVNPAMVRQLGYDSQVDLAGKEVSAIVHAGDLEAAAERTRAMTATLAPAPPREMRFHRKDGSTVPAEVAAMPIEYQGKPAIVVIGRDLTERKQFTAKMMEMDRMIAVGTLAAGVGHEINSPLSYVIANLDLLAERLHHEAGSVSGKRDESIQLLDEAREGAMRIRDIVRDLKTFSRAGASDRAPQDVRRLLDSSINLTWNEIRHRAQLIKDYGDVPAVEANEARLAQVFVNLLVNAAQAIGEGAAHANAIRVRTRTDGERVIVEVEDTGSGIPDEHLDRVFDPFFTTKAGGQGTGLGLAICKETVESCGGTIAVESQLGRGTTFRVALPATRAARQAEPAALAAAAGAGLRRGRILVVDDDPIVARTVRRILSADHDVVALTSAREAMDRLDAGERFDVILCDLMMPEMSGMDLHARLLEAVPEQAGKMVFLTGGAFTLRAREFLDTVPNRRVDKPFDVMGLRALVRDLLT